jgi:hypothetical protein
LSPKYKLEVGCETSPSFRPFQIDDAAGVVRIALVSARIVCTKVGIPLEIKLSGQWLMPRMPDHEVDVGGPVVAVQLVTAWDHCGKRERAGVISQQASTKAKGVVFVVVLAVGIGLPDVEKGPSKGRATVLV